MRTLLAFLLSAVALLAAEPVEFNRDIRPILSENCYQCHGPDANQRMADLRLDERAAAIEKGAIQPGDAAASKLISRIRTHEDALRMPPAYSDKRLTPEQIAILERWVSDGAEYQSHWAYVAPKRPQAPEGPAAIDHLVSRKLDAQGLEPVGEADRRTLIRRVSLDLTGLPPEPAAVEAFLEDRRPDAYQRLVERYLASPHYGERMAVYWLDLVRYADTTGFHNDVPFAVHPYRDYVIEAFNANMPFDRFTREQLAGDLLPDATDEQKVASAYNRLNRLTTEGGAQAKEYLAIYAADRVRTTATVWLASTLTCAECHDHKFDPFLTREFYELGAFFADIEEDGVFERDGEYGPVMQVLSPQAKAEIARIDAELGALRAAGAAKLEPSRKTLASFRKHLRKTAESWAPLTPAEAREDCSNPDIDGCDDFDLAVANGGFLEIELVADKKPREGELVADYELPAGRPVTALLYEVEQRERFEEFLLSEIQVEVLGRGERPLAVQLGALVPDEESESNLLRRVIDGNDVSGWGGKLEDGPRRAMFALAAPLRLRKGERMRVRWLHNGRGDRTMPGRFRLSASTAQDPEPPLPAALEGALAASGPAANETLRTVFETTTEGNPSWRRIRALERRRKTLQDHAPLCHIASAVEDPREMRVLPRGNWMDDSGAVVEPNTPRFLNTLDVEDRRATRLDLANWLVSRDNPLTARVFVNRLWKMFFGTGLSKVLNDVGAQGETPVNLELLDWLAVDFMESGWDIERLVRTVLLSQTYRRSSNPSPELAAKDPFNRLHGRQSMIRLDAEMIRDGALKVSGLLNPRIGGPSVKPYQPAGYYQELNFPKREYEPDYDRRQFRRGLYTHWQRTFLHPSLMAFDAPSREECTAERTVSNTPLQSLALLNDPTYVEAARAFAANILAARGDKLDWAYQRAFGRPASPQEKAVLERLLATARAELAADQVAAGSLLATGITPAPAKLDRVELAAWTSVARALLNKHELMMRY